MRRYENRSTLMTSNRPIEEWGKLSNDVPAASAILDRCSITQKSSPSPDAVIVSRTVPTNAHCPGQNPPHSINPQNK
jgi:hypothetical protein